MAEFRNKNNTINTFYPYTRITMDFRSISRHLKGKCPAQRPKIEPTFSDRFSAEERVSL